MILIHSYLKILPTPIVHIGLLVSLVLKSLGLVYDVLLHVIECLVLLVAPLEVAEVDPLRRVWRRQHHAGAWPRGVSRVGGAGGHQ